MIEIHNLTKKFRSLTAVNCVSLDIPTGSVFGLLGTNGAGKSTLLRMLTGILRPDSGTIHIEGQHVWDNEVIKANCFYLSDRQYHFPNASAETMGRFYQKLYSEFEYDRYLDLLETFHLDSALKLRTFSKGMQKQAGILAAVCANTAYIFCDEVFDGLDPVIRQSVSNLINSELTRRTLTIVVASHNLRELEHFCSRIGILHKGGILLSKDVHSMQYQTHKIQCIIWLLMLSVYLYVTYIIDYTLAQSGQRLLFGDSRLGPANNAVFWFTILLAVFSALQGFGFLFSEEKTGFYFALPVKRRRLFFSVYTNGLLLSLVPCILSRLVCYFIEGSRSSDALYEVWMGILVSIIGFLLVYHLILCVVLLTGQLIAAACGVGLVFFYGIFTFGYVFQKYSSSFFDTYYKIDLINALAVYVSPYHLYSALSGSKTIQEIGEWKLYDYIIPFLAVLFISSALFAAAYFLFLKRPAESAGKTLAFQRSECIVKFIIAIPVIMIAGYYTMSLSLSSRSLALLVMGIFVCSFAINGVLESLFQTNIKCFFSHRIHTVLLAAVCIAGCASFYFDIWQFDSYLPHVQDVDSAAVYIYGLDDEEDTPSPHSLSNFYRADPQLDSMHLTKETKEALILWISDIREVKADDAEPLTYVTVGYHTNNNKTTYRKYPIYQPEDLDAFSVIYDSPDYKTGASSLLTDANLGTRHFTWSNGIETFHLDLTEKENKELLKRIQNDSLSLSMKDLKSALPIGTLSLVYTGAATGEQLFLYPDFEATLSYLESLGLPARKTIENYEVIAIQIFEKFSETSTFGKVTSSRKRIVDTTYLQEIQELLPALFPDSYTVNPLLYPTASEYQAIVSIRDSQGRTLQYCTMTLKSGQITDTLPSLDE